MATQEYRLLDPINKNDNRERCVDSLNFSNKTEDATDFTVGILKWIHSYRKNLGLYLIILLVAIFFVVVVLSLHLTTLMTTSTCVPQKGLFLRSETRIFQGVAFTIVWDPKRNWIDAVDACARTCSVLASANSFEEKIFLKKVIGSTYSAWIGGTIINRTKYEWIENNEPVPNNIWNPGEPNNPNTEQCMELYRSEAHGANDKKCISDLPFICKRIK